MSDRVAVFWADVVRGDISDVGVGVAGRPLRGRRPVLLSIRPERVSIAPEPGMYTNEFEATVDDVTFLGDHSASGSASATSRTSS